MSDHKEELPIRLQNGDVIMGDDRINVCFTVTDYNVMRSWEFGGLTVANQDIGSIRDRLGRMSKGSRELLSAFVAFVVEIENEEGGEHESE